MKPRIEYNEEKNLLLKAARGIGFQDIIIAIQTGRILDDKQHHHKSRQHQRILVVNINNYAYAVPYVFNRKTNTIFLKTIFPSRVFTKKYLRK